MKEKDNILINQGTLLDNILNNIEEVVNEKKIIDAHLGYMKKYGSMSDDFYDLTQNIVNVESLKFVNYLIDNEIFIKKTSNKNSNNLSSHFFKINGFSFSSRISIMLKLDEKETKFVIDKDRLSSPSAVLSITLLSQNPDTNVFSDYRTKETNSVLLNDITVFAWNTKDYIYKSELQKVIDLKVNEIKKKKEEIAKITEELSTFNYVSNFMEKNKINFDKIYTIKTKMILDVIKEGKDDEVVDIETNINEIIKITV